MPLSPTQVRKIESTKSHYGCGNGTCVNCYPIQYACEFCNTQFDQPIANGEHYECVECGYDNKEEY